MFETAAMAAADAYNSAKNKKPAVIARTTVTVGTQNSDPRHELIVQPLKKNSRNQILHTRYS